MAWSHGGEATELSQSAENRPGKETQGRSMRLPSSGRERRTSCLAVVDPLPQFATEAEGCCDAKERKWTGDKVSISPSCGVGCWWIPWYWVLLRFCINFGKCSIRNNELARTQTIGAGVRGRTRNPCLTRTNLVTCHTRKRETESLHAPHPIQLISHGLCELDSKTVTSAHIFIGGRGPTICGIVSKPRHPSPVCRRLK